VYQVTRKYQDNDIQREVGELVTGTGYRYLTRLVELRYLKDVGAEPTSFRCELCSRAYSSQETLEEHYVKNHPDEIEIDDDSTPDNDEGKPESNEDKTDGSPEEKQEVKNDEPNDKRKGKGR